MGDRPGPADALDMVPAPNPKVAARVVNGEAMILTPHDSVLHTLNTVGTRIWELLPAHATVAGLAAAIVEEYDVSPEEATADVRELIAVLVEKRILVL